MGDPRSSTAVLFVVPGATFLVVNVCFAVLFDLPQTMLAVCYLAILEFAAVGVSFQVAEQVLSAWYKPVLLPQLDVLDAPPPVALLCVTCDDVDPVLLRELSNQTYPALSVFVLDDSTTPCHRALTDASGHCVVRRQTRQGYKAGNINHWLRRHEAAYKYFLVVDADSRLPPRFVDELVRHAEHPANSRVAVIETQIRAWNRSSRFAAALDDLTFVRDQYRLRVTNRFGSTLSVGHNNLYRTEAVSANGGFTEAFIAEDFATSIAIMSGRQWLCRAVPIVSYERQPENIAEYARRQSRWAYQTLQLLTLPVPDVSWPVTLELVRAFHYYLSPVVVAVGLLLAVAWNLQASLWRLWVPSWFGDVPAVWGWWFWALWLGGPAIATFVQGTRHGVRLRDVALSMLVHSALCSVTAWAVIRQVVALVVGRNPGFVVTGRRAAPTLTGTLRLAGPITVLAWGSAASTLFHATAFANFVWLIPMCFAPFIVHAVQRVRPRCD